MKLDKAIEILSRDIIPNYPYAIGEKARAIQLAIETLKRIHNARVNGTFASCNQLPGETED